jgi:hypothetical protein
MNGSYKAELIWNKGPWKSYEELNRATAERVCWHNESCITEYNNYRSAMYMEDKWSSEGADLRKKRKVS